MTVQRLVWSAALAFGGGAVAAPQFAEIRAMGADDRPIEVRPERAPPAAIHPGKALDLTRGPSLAGRGDAAARGVLVSFTDDLECLQLFPTPLNGQAGCAVWSGAPITGLNRWLASTVSGRTTFAVNDPVDGNATVKVRLMASAASPQDQFFFGARYEFLRTNAPLARLGFGPDTGQPARAEHDMFVASIATMWTSEPVHISSGFIVSRLLWGGTCVAGCADIGLPTGALPGVYVLGLNPNSFLTGIFRTCEWIGSAPLGQSAGDDVVMQSASWVRVRHQTTANGLVEAALDYLDGTGFHTIYSDTFITGTKIDALNFNGSYELANSPAYVDSISASGVEVSLPTHPTPLECGPSGYLDDVEWLNVGALGGQSQLWFDALSSRAAVVNQGSDKIICQSNVFSDGRYREEFTRTLPSAVATPGQPWTLCEDTRISTANVTPRGVAPVSFLDNSFVTRVQLGHWDPFDAPPYKGRVFVQHNPAYSPIDDEDSPDPTLPGPNGNGGVARIGGAAAIGDPNFDYYDSGVSLANNQWRKLCIEVASDDAMTITYGVAQVVGGATGVTLNAFVHSLDELRHESENTLGGNGDSFCVDDVHLQCVRPPDVILPPLTLVYHDPLEWAAQDVTIDANDDDGNPATPFRWTSAPNMPVVNVGGANGLALRMENLFSDTAQVQGDFTLFTQASTQMPNVAVSANRGYAAGGQYRMTDGLTTRAWMVAEADVVPGLFRTNASILYSAGTGTLWRIEPDPVDPVQNDPVWVDTGRSLASLGVNFNQWFTLTIHHNLNGTFIFKINGAILTDSGSAVVRAMPLQSADGGLHNNLDRLFFLGGDDETAPSGSILFADNIKAWALPCLGDTNDDGVVNFADINNILGNFNAILPPTQSPNVAPDADGDGVADDHVVNFADLNAALGQFNNPCD